MYKNLTLSHLRNAIRTFFHGKQKQSLLTYDELRKKILPGYFYSIDSGKEAIEGKRNMTVHTGIGGVLLYIDACEATKWITAEDAAKSIFCHTSKGDFNMLQIKLKSKE